MKSPSSADSRDLVPALEQLLRDRENVLLDDLLGQRRDEAVVDQHDAVDLLALVQLGDAMGDRLGVVVRGAVAEPDPGLVDLVAAEGQRRAALSPGDEPAHLDALRPQAPVEREGVPETWALNAPARPRSPVIATIAARFTSRRWSSVSPWSEVLARAVPIISSIIRSAYGRIASMRACARRSLAEATSSNAFVIFWVLRIDRIRRLRSWTVAMG
jgi:hypothetical protein